jgi:tryptophan synthase beta chain
MTLEQSEILGHFGPYGGRFVPEALIEALDELAAAHASAQQDPAFIAEFKSFARYIHW